MVVRIIVISISPVRLDVMATQNVTWWESLEQWTPRLFVLAGIILLVAAVNYAVTFLVDSIEFNAWIGLTVIIGRVVSLLGVAGLSVWIVSRKPRQGKMSRVVVSLAIIITTGLLVSAVLRNLGFEPPLTPVLGLGTVALSIVTYALFGALLLRSDTASPLLGSLLLVAVVALLFALFGRIALPLGVVGIIAEGVLFLAHIAMGYHLRTGPEPEDQVEPAPDTVVE